MPGCGKTTLGRALSARSGLPFTDLDEAVEADAGMSVRQIFAAEGEDSFRRRESEKLAHLAAQGPAIIACGGGTPCHGSNMDAMLAAGRVVWLEASAPTLTRRLCDAQAQRPLLNGKDEDGVRAYVDATLRERAPFYSRAHARFDADDLESIPAIDAAVERFISLYIPNHHTRKDS